jgi:hypothetical protein
LNERGLGVGELGAWFGLDWFFWVCTWAACEVVIDEWIEGFASGQGYERRRVAGRKGGRGGEAGLC